MKTCPLYARKDENGNYQMLSIHLNNVVIFSENFAGKFSNTAKLSAMLHDIGKASQAFQNYLLNNGIRGRVVHSLQAAFYISDIPTDKASCFHLLAQELLEMIIAAHHGCLSDAIDVYGENIFLTECHPKMMKNIITVKLSTNLRT